MTGHESDDMTPLHTTPRWTAAVETTAATDLAVPVLFSGLLALVHVVSGRWQIANPGVHRRAVSAAGGASVAYVFVLLLPEISEAALLVGERRSEALLAEQSVYVLALAGFVAFYGVEVLVTRRTHESVEEATPVFWAHVAVFAAYSAVIGYLLFHQEAPGVWNQVFYTLAMALHFGVTDAGLHRHHGDLFDRRARWILAGGTLAGSALGLATGVSGLGLTMLFGFVSGALVLNVIKEELPEIDENRFAAFALGVGAYTVVLLAASG